MNADDIDLMDRFIDMLKGDSMMGNGLPFDAGDSIKGKGLLFADAMGTDHPYLVPIIFLVRVFVDDPRATFSHYDEVLERKDDQNAKTTFINQYELKDGDLTWVTIFDPCFNHR